MTLTLYADPRSTCSRRVLMMLCEKQIDFTLSIVNLSKGEQKSEEHMKRQPFGKVPVLGVAGSGTVYESFAICEYIADLDGPSLKPSSLFDVAIMRQWISIHKSYFSDGFSKIFYEKIIKPRYNRGSTDETVVEAGRTLLGPVLDIFEARLAVTGAYLAGADCSVADIVYVPEFDMLHAAGSGDLVAARPALAAWWARLSARESWTKAQAYSAQV